MNSRLRVLLIGRHFWPHGSIDSAGYLIQLASGLQRQGIHVEVLTPRYASAWPAEIDFREIKVHRPFAAPRSDWSMSRYLRNIGNWLNQHAGAFDVLLVDSAREEAIATVESAKALSARSTQVRAVVRVSGYGENSDRLWWETSRSSRRCAGFAKRADKVIVENAQDERGLLSQGFAATTLSRIDDGFDPAVLRTPENRIESRRALAAINGDFHAPANEPVALCVTNMVRDSGVQILIESARHIVARFPDLHLWFIGDGPRRDSIFQFLRGDGVRASIAMPGSFGNMEDVYRAADIFIHSEDLGMQTFLPNAISAELPIVAVDNQQTRMRLRSDTPSTASGESPNAAINNESCVHWFQSSSPKSFRKAVRSALDDLDDSQQKAANLKRNLVRARSYSETIDDYAKMLRQVKHQSSSPLQDGSSFGAVS